MRHLPLLIVLALGMSSCFPELPDPRVVTNLRVLAIQADPAVAPFNPFEPPAITVRALVAHPANEELTDVRHDWGLDLGDEDFEGKAELEALLPDGPYGTSITLDLAPLFEQRDGGWISAALPLSYSAADEELTRDAVKLVSFLLPDPEFGTGDDDDSAESAPPLEQTETEIHNANPSIDAIVLGETRFEGDALGVDTVLDVGDVTTTEGLQLVVEWSDDGDREDVGVQLYWTSGSAGLPPEPGGDDDGFGFGGGGGPGGGFGASAEDDPELGDGQLVRDETEATTTIGWTPSEWDEAPAPRLWLVLLDAQGGQTWQAIRPR